MADKLTCPSCQSHTSAVFRAAMGVDTGGRWLSEPTFRCPYCESVLPATVYDDAVFQP